MAHNTLIIDSGARGHALYETIVRSPLVDTVICAPGNAGIPQKHCRPIDIHDVHGLLRLVVDEKINFVVVGPEASLMLGIVDNLQKIGVRVFGPTREAAQLEGSKIFTKRMCGHLSIPIASWTWADTFDEAALAIRTWDSPPIIKADGLCEGKGVVVSKTIEEALSAAHAMLVDNIHGAAGSRIVIEDRLLGVECSLTAICDGINALLLPMARDYKRVFEGNQGPNTGGMGSYSPLPDIRDELAEDMRVRIVLPILKRMHELGAPFHGIMYVGLMMTDHGPHVIEINVRLGDPEAQVILPRVADDLMPIFLLSAETNGLHGLPPLRIRDDAAVCTVLASGGYPDHYEVGFPITGIEAAQKKTLVLHACTKREGKQILTAGGRVMSCIGLAPTLAQAREESLAAARRIIFEGKHFRTDIAENV